MASICLIQMVRLSWKPEQSKAKMSFFYIFASKLWVICQHGMFRPYEYQLVWYSDPTVPFLNIQFDSFLDLSCRRSNYLIHKKVNHRIKLVPKYHFYNCIFFKLICPGRHYKYVLLKYFLMSWIKRAIYHVPIILCYVNYTGVLIEQSLDFCRLLNTPGLRFTNVLS